MTSRRIAADDALAPILAGLRPLAVPIDRLRTMPGNPHRANVAALERSWRQFGQRRPLIARRDSDADTGEVIAGNHGLEVARRLGWSHVAVAWVDDDDPTAKAFAAADNRTAQLGSEDPALLAELLLSVRASDTDLFAATAYTEAELVELLTPGGKDESKPASDSAEGMADQAIAASWAVIVTCSDEATQLELLDRLAGEGLQCRALIS